MATGTDATAVIRNGFDVTALGELAGMLKQDGEAGRVTFRGRSRWRSGARVATRFTGYDIDGQACHEDEREFVLTSDEPVELTGTDATPGPVELLLHAVAACVLATTTANAAFMGVELSRLELEIAGDLDLHGFFGVDESVRPGLSGMRVRVIIDGDADEETLREVVRRGLRFSPVRESVANGVAVEPEVVVGTRTA